MRRIRRYPGLLSPLSFLLLASLILVSCSRNGGSKGNRKGKDSQASILKLQTPLGLTGTRGTGPDIPLVYNLRDREYDPADVEIQYGIDVDDDGTIEESEYFPASPAEGGSGTTGLNTSPGPGSVHSFVWSSLTDITTGRYVTQDFVYTDAGRVATDAFGDSVFQNFPGVRLRVRPISNDKVGKWVESDAFGVSNNNTPSVTLGDLTIPLEGKADNTVNEDVTLSWTAFDPDGDPVTIAVDWVAVPQGYDPASKTDEELEALPWQWATSSSAGDGTSGLAADRNGTGHTFVWNSVKDTGTVNTWVLLRIQPLDAKREVGKWVYLDEPFHLDNYTIFTDPDASLPGNRVGAVATLLSDESVLVTGGRPSETDAPTDSVVQFFPGQSQTTKGTVAEIGTMTDARAHHSSTRLLDGRVLVVGGSGASGAAIGSAEIFDPDSREFTAASSALGTPRTNHVAVLLRSGNVLIAGGEDANGDPLSSAEIYDHESGAFVPVLSTMTTART
ncbi:MAG: kelch repeat-containing protein, partial [Planctomycetota bacterium]